ncbi:hypothetical protein ACUYFE_01380 [Olegusella massiliensis]|uniref:hypothetical protein n=1 Tax=Olegusella massiliensis TaxID=1776381 RepID=UPI00405543C1
MAENSGKKNHRLVDKMVIHVETAELGHEISYDRFREMLDGYDALLGTLEDSRTYNPNDMRTQQQETADMKMSHRLYLSPAVEGSYAVEARLYDDSEELDRPLPLFGEGFGRVLRVIDYAASGDVDAFIQEVPSKLARKNVLDGLRKVSPQTSEKITVTSGLKLDNTTELKQADIIPFPKLQPVEEEYFDAEIIGHVVLVDFENKKLQFRPNGAKRRFAIQYDPEIEDRLVETRYKLMTVKCKVRYNINGDIADIADADGIEELELRPVEVSSFEAEGATHHFKNPITVTVELDETGQVYLGIFEELNLCVYVEHQEEMRQEILDDLAWCWTEIAMAREEELAPDAITVRNTFLDLVAD